MDKGRRFVSRSRLGPYEVISALGAGGQGEVYRARDPRLNRDVAIKVLPEHLSQDQDALLRFEREARAIAALSHPNVLTIFDVGSDRGTHYVVTELLEGDTLKTRLTQRPMTWRDASEVGRALAEGIAAAHGRAIIHRDLKPGNVFLTSDGRVKILDFGLAHFEQALSAADDARTGNLTATGAVLGTVGYMSPEQVRGSFAGPGADIFALGCILYEMLSGRRAFDGATSAETLSSILRDTPSGLTSTGSAIPAELERLVFHCLEKQPERRFQSARDLAFALTAIVEHRDALPGADLREGVTSIAVLPFVNASRDPDTEYLSDGITESIINSLARLSRLHVTPRSTVFRYRDERLDPQDVGRTLNVRAVLTGRVVQRGERLVVAAELIDVIKGSQLWGERYNRRLADIFALEEDIARRISETLRMKLTGQEERLLAKRFTDDHEAYQLYLKGRRHWIKRTPDQLKQGAEYFQLAIAKDPGYALAYAGLADCYTVLSAYAMTPPRESWAKAKAAAAAAIELDPELAEGHTSLGIIRAVVDWDFDTALNELQRAADLNPAYWIARHWYGLVLIMCGRHEEADRQIRQAWELEPRSPVVAFAAAVISICSRRYDQAVERASRGVECDPDHPLLRLYLGVAYEQLSRYEEAIRHMQLAAERLNASTVTGQLAHAHARSGNRREAKNLLDTILEQATQGPVDYYAVAIGHVGLGDVDGAFRWLETACQNRGVGSLTLLVKGDPRLDGVRSDPRFGRILQRMGLDG